MRTVTIGLTRLAYIRTPRGQFKDGDSCFVAPSGKVPCATSVLEPPESGTGLNFQVPTSRLFSGQRDAASQFGRAFAG
jgi:hypothetical protein